mgnify:CR=1 FL=1
MPTLRELSKSYAAQIRAGATAQSVAASIRSLRLDDSGDELSGAQNKLIVDGIKEELVSPAGRLVEADNKYIMDLVSLLQDLLDS